MRQFDIVAYGAARGVVVENDLIPHDRFVTVIPLIEGYPAAGALTPVLEVGGARLVLATRMIGALPRAALRATGENIERDALIRAVDILVTGV